ncbi:MAG: orotidine 5'-phosphate decarboxylase [Candidatus Edwardsbacteria bacterium RIFOXYD12_FULL_50_11]|jgi:orotidine-5'-phosphate decarboxylase|uniref:Orotidine 5'-phosphate decarboxylase n=1 Tax=Candidatus Edwardsbacteria bacterium GWF2_54_11 TaxID=1817851 RepID=A0A1F5QZU9_9BACT|nr:MAG: orotidine 5'-phosphate decarboxylase [Candidatus Edwardsbacteria bacterium RifOxyC12_full_54_24]OGF07181.1 MAG: orotidine 5'-phosphate decarboxylase [Candidatus Edwardsbacteria bacterium GWF2_54_11]OGF08594.1 MAG: orotidine 5'-phosphate decarboxylase [Candidatus Edwardsbacteria bacterium RifOxyA12_full_54_48]OGF11238.1 MAG: orotidine 5'-phosphate decarboxylase [Candidatus Edwardsbacteria bacterium GWE2_54_12]OGF16819.1 MAG: orotidine 5'-phosphate decarboxylase [Candidatus Edwardsbacteri
MNISPRDRLIVALDVPDLKQAQNLIDRLGSSVNFYKVGNQLFTSCGPKIVELIKERGHQVFLDLKYHDIPNTVARAAQAAYELGVDMFNMHAMGGFSMMETAATTVTNSASSDKKTKPVMLGVTVLTSMDEATFQDVLGTPGRSIEEQVLHLARLSQSAGLDGVVASPHEIAMLRQELGSEFVILTPGIRPADSSSDDQKRFLTPGQAISTGADYLVVGRPITAAKDPADAATKIIKEIEDALK